MPYQLKFPKRNSWVETESHSILKIKNRKGEITYVLVDLEFTKELQHRTWRILQGRGPKGCRSRYVVSGTVGHGDGMIFMAHVVSRCPDGWFCGFRNDDSLDCRVSNLFITNSRSTISTGPKG